MPVFHFTQSLHATQPTELSSDLCGNFHLNRIDSFLILQIRKAGRIKLQQPVTKNSFYIRR